MPKLKELVLLLAIATVSGNILKDVINKIEEKASDDNLACNIAVNRQIIECSVEVKSSMVPEGTTCIFLDDYALHHEHFVCVKGFFIYVDHLHKGTDVNQVRIKRSVEWIVGGVIGLIGLVFYGVHKLVEYLRGPRRDSVRNLPPTIECPKETTYVADKLQTTVKVEFPHPTATDPENQKVSIYNVLKQNGERKLSEISDGTFEKGRHEMEYIAVDNVGNTVSCTYIFHVNVIECDSHKHVDHGRVDCNPVRTLYGSVCTFTCYTGYQLSKNSVASKTCEKTGKWSSSSDVKCIKKMCGNPPTLSNGRYYCPDRGYDGRCQPSCNKGYSLEEVRHTGFVRCDGNAWINIDKFKCKDTEPPTVTYCPASIVKIASYSKGKANISWEPPTASDNSGTTVTIKQVSGNQPGTLFEVGLHKISYIATDNAGNMNEKACEFTVVVEELKCAPLVVEDKNLKTTCPDGYIYGSSCKLECFQFYNLTGDASVTCEKDPNDENKAFWNWTNKTQTTCKKLLCPDLPVPVGGALACSEALGNQICTMSCSSKYQVPKTTPIEYVCSDQQIWIQGIPPNCTAKVHPNNAYKPGELFYYYTGDCSNTSVQDGIKENFVHVMKNLEKTDKWKNICPHYCNVQNVSVTCGELNGKRKRALHLPNMSMTSKITVNFHVLSEWNTDTDFWGNDELLTQVADFLQEKLSDGMFHVSGLTTGNMVIGYMDMSCPLGQEPVYEGKGTCVGCPPGKYLKGDECINCEKGYYQENEYQINCTKCPPGESTEKSGSQFPSDCMKICQPGTYSSTGIVPCLPCPIGQYQSGYESTTCIKCDSLTFTESTGSSHKTDCQEMDVNFISENASIKLPELKDKVENFSFGFVMKCSKITDQIALFKISNFDLSVGTTLNISIAGHSDSIDLDLIQWSQIVVTWQVHTKEVKIYANRELKKSLIFNVESTQDIEIGAGSFMEISAFTSACSFAGFFFSSDVLSDQSLSGPTKSCFTSVTESLYSMDNIFSAEMNGILFLHSRCDAFDECSRNPCGDRNKCVNKNNDYDCVCYGGYSGVNCEIPPNFCLGNKCENGGTCTSNFFDYTCTCSKNYTGVRCETIIVHGNWGHWLEWSECSRSCEGGQQTRGRLCNNPSPGPDGLSCVGSKVSTQICNNDTCPVCPDHESIYQYKNKFNCSTNNDSISCIVTCQSGYVFAKDFQPLDRYECGPHTSYIWNAKPPPCANVRSPRGIAVATLIKYTTDCNNQDKIESAVLQNLNDLQCIQNKTCSVKAKVSGCSSSNRNRRFTTPVGVSIHLNSDLPGDDDLKLEDFYTNKIVSPALRQLVFVYFDVASSIHQMNTTDILTLNVSGNIYEADTSTLNVTTTLMCPEGTFEDDLVCTECPIGTFWRNDICEMCPRKTFQDSTGQLQCKQCPDGFTTLYIASKNVSDCFVPLETKISSVSSVENIEVSSEPDDIPLETKISSVSSVENIEVSSEPDDNYFVLQVFVPISVAVVVSGIIVIVLLIYRKLRGRQLYTIGSTISLNDAVTSAYKTVQDEVSVMPNEAV